MMKYVLFSFDYNGFFASSVGKQSGNCSLSGMHRSAQTTECLSVIAGKQMMQWQLQSVRECTETIKQLNA